ncbi:MAG: hypothetical protein D6805_08050 [Planctomycetota bacterium]|nr:MAG: hypothetical protein D6805_08050 [Planctomycetota bacterium]
MKVRKRRAQGMTEYIIIVVLVGIGLIAAVKLFGLELKTIITGSEKAVKNKVEPDADGGFSSGGGGGRNNDDDRGGAGDEDEEES